MCGITGFIDNNRHQQDPKIVIQKMTDALRHRGPSDQGIWVDHESAIALGHRRLSILDLSAEGHQPMVSASQRYIIVYNGEVYNFKELRKELEPIGYSFRGHSDTEVILAAIETWGLHKAVERFIGMFALALWDKQEKTLSLVRDRLGIKPLYYGHLHGTFIFASELKAIRSWPGFNLSINQDALALLMQRGYIPSPYSIYSGIQKLPAGNILTLKQKGDPKLSTYWSVAEMTEQGFNNPYTGTDQDAMAELEKILQDSIKLRMVADVPLGTFLSGGIDSSLVTALMQAQSPSPIKTFSIGFNEAGFNEAMHARAVAQHLKTEHTEFYTSPQDALNIIPDLPLIYDEPFADPSQIPTYLVSKLAKKYVTVTLSGDGGDELFYGYSHYISTVNRWKQINCLPQSLKNLAITTLSKVTSKDCYTSQSIIDILRINNDQALYSRGISHWKDPTPLLKINEMPITPLTDPLWRKSVASLESYMMATDMMTYLPDDILVKMDRASMAVSLEARVPLLDHRVAEFAARLPLSMKYRNNTSKWILRQLLYKYVDRKLVDRPKMGFSVPIATWLRGPLKEWAATLLDETRLKNEGHFNPEPIIKKWNEHINGKQNWEHCLWNTLMFQAWLEAQ